MAITSLALLLTSGLSLFNQIDNTEQLLKSDVITASQIIGIAYAEQMQSGDVIELSNYQNLPGSIPVKIIHLYDAALQPVAQFTNLSRSPVGDMSERKEELENPVITDTYIEVMTPVLIERDIVGYSYVRASTEQLEALISDAIIIAVVVLLLMLVLCFLLVMRLQERVTRPIENLVNLSQRVAKQKDYSARAVPTGITELNKLADGINVMLERMQDYMLGQEQAEEEHRKLNASLEEKVNQRTLALKEANQELIQTLEKLHQFQRQMVQNEKMASLGDMVAGVAHEVNTPIGLGVTASTMMLDRLKSLDQEFQNKSLKASTLSKFINEGQENLNIIYRNLNRAAELISSFKQVAVDQSSEGNRTFSFAKLMDEILLSLRPRLKKVQHDVNVHCDENLFIETKAGPINQIMINLIMNSVIHGFENIEHGQIDIYVEMIGDNKLNIVYKDNGVGIPEHLRKRIFDPFVTTKRGQGGSGLGMHLVYNLVTQALNGSISITSEEGAGVEFQIIFPVRRVAPDLVAKSS
ncbi:sensor histidine kinase [Aestuariibacter salexigens]|uniref:sensor histidine kinase n=1 Tax=Aestuariibacter salexigens TaxID=226010 RepID=UPI0006860252|nr:ATP-binding protein [Aestuariibacter salexigens]